MSGIAGVLHTDGRPADRSQVAGMLVRLGHRGPHGERVWASDSVALGHCLLRNTPEAQYEVQPLVDAATGVAVVADARIDNREDLAPILGIDPRVALETPDSVFLLRAYLKWGTACPQHVLGDYAFAVWDGRSRRLVLVRDAFGIRPLFYHHSANSVWFASEIRALHAVGEVPRALDEAHIAGLLVPLFDDLSGTCYERICRVPRGHSVTFDAFGARAERYFEIDTERELVLGSDAEYEEAFRAVFGEAVRCRLRHLRGVGTTLSGGLDSSAVACVARRVLPPSIRLHTFSAVFPQAAELDPRIDERAYIDAVLEVGDFTPNFVEADRAHPLRDLIEVQEDEFIPAPGLYMGKAIVREAANVDVDVLLSGFDGDVVVSYGHELLVDLARSGRWDAFLSEARLLAQREGRLDERQYFRAFGLPSLRNLADARRWLRLASTVLHLPREFDYRPTRAIRRLVLPSLAPFRRADAAAEPDQGLNVAIRPELADRVGLGARRVAAAEHGFDTTAPLRVQHARGILDGRIEHAVSAYDRMGGARRVEQRYPFLDRRVIDFCVSVPFSQRLGDGRTRWLFRRAMRGVMPEAVRLRAGKGHLGAGLRVALKREEPLIRELLGRLGGTAGRFIDEEKVEPIFARFLADPAKTSETDVFSLVLAVSLAAWLEKAGG